MATETKQSTALNVNDRVEKTLIPLCCNSVGKSSYFPYKKQWNVHFDDEQGNHYYLFTTSEDVVRQAMDNVGKAVRTRFIVAGIRNEEHCIRIKNLKIQD